MLKTKQKNEQEMKTMSRKTVDTVEREREREREQCLIKTWLGFVAKEGKKEQEKSKFREGSLSKVASKKINQKQKENEYKWEKRVDCI